MAHADHNILHHVYLRFEAWLQALAQKAPEGIQAKLRLAALMCAHCALVKVAAAIPRSIARAIESNIATAQVASHSVEARPARWYTHRGVCVSAFILIFAPSKISAVI